ncbi:alpha/beta hydrolase [Bacteroidales bacterium OttesenSCG-928-C19]|nr:alpha/beta hydrolase [Bacteroidales bacterium OttesenSCG-928-C19]
MSKSFAKVLLILEMNNSKIFFRAHGEGNPVVFLHGILGSHSQWIPFVNDLPGCQLLLPDLPNHGNSAHIPTMNYNEISYIIYEWILSLGINNITIAGHSYGGRVAIKLVNDYPDLFKKLILIDSSNVKSEIPHSVKRWLNIIREGELTSFASYSEIRNHLKKFEIPESERELLLKNIKREGTFFSWKSNAQVIANEISSVVNSVPLKNVINHPTFLMRGKNSGHVPDAHLSEMRKMFPNLEDIVIENAGHWVHVDNRNKFVELLKSAIKK